MASSEIGSSVGLESSRIGLLSLKDLLVMALQGIASAPRYTNIGVYYGFLRPRQGRMNLREEKIQYDCPV